MKALTVTFLAIILMSAATYAQAPDITGHTVLSMRSVDFVFSDQMYRSSVEAPANMAIYPTGSPGESLETWTVYLDADRITMHLYLIEPMIDGVSYTLALDGVMNSSYVPVQEGFEYIFTATDLVPPALHAVLFLAPDLIDLRFTEDIVESEGEDTSNYSLFETSAPGNIIGFDGARMRGIHDRINLELVQDMVPGLEYTITAADLHDLSGNPLPGGSELVFTYTGTNSRSLMGLYADFERRSTAVSGTGTYSFDMWTWVLPREAGAEGILFKMNYPSNVVPHTEELNPDYSDIIGDIYNSVGILFDQCQYDWVWIYRQTLTVTDGQPSLVSIYPFVDTFAKNAYIFECARERNQIPMGVTSNIEINAPDARPVAVTASFSGHTIVDIIFSIPMDQPSAETISNYEIFETSSPGNIISISSATLQADGRTVRLVSSADLSAGTDYTARLTDIESAVGVPIYPGSEITFAAIDVERPDLVSAARTGQHTVDVVFTEPVDDRTANSVLNYDIVRASDNDSHVELNSASLQEDGITVRLTVNSPMEDGTHYVVLASNVADLWGNIMLSLRRAEFTSDDIYPPAILSISSIPGNILKVHFTEVVDSATAVDMNNYMLSGSPMTHTSAVWEGNDVILSRSIDYTYGGLYHLQVQNIEDQPGNAIPSWETTDFYYTPETPAPLIGLWSDAGRLGSGVQAYPYEIFEFYLWCKPGPSGIIAIEHALQNTSLQNLEYHIIGIDFDPDYSLSFGDIFSGITITMYECKTDWFWMIKCTCVLIDGRGYIDVIPHPLWGGPQGVTCTEYNRPIAQFDVASRLTINEFLIGTLLQSSSAEYDGTGIEVTWVMLEIDEEPDFIISRRKVGEAYFVTLEFPSIVKEGMSYSFVDSDIEKGASYVYRVEYPEGGEIHTLFETEEVGTPSLPLTLHQNWPNPFNPSTSIGYYLPTSCNVRLEIYDAAGRLVNALQNGVQPSGNYSVDWNGTNSAGSQVSSGVYFYRLTAGKETISKKMVLLR